MVRVWGLGLRVQGLGLQVLFEGPDLWIVARGPSKLSSQGSSTGFSCHRFLSELVVWGFGCWVPGFGFGLRAFGSRVRD